MKNPFLAPPRLEAHPSRGTAQRQIIAEGLQDHAHAKWEQALERYHKEQVEKYGQSFPETDESHFDETFAGYVHSMLPTWQQNGIAHELLNIAAPLMLENKSGLSVIIEFCTENRISLNHQAVISMLQ